MNFYRKLKQLETQSKPLGIGVIGAGKFAAMYLVQANRTPGVCLVAVADRVEGRAEALLQKIDWQDRRGDSVSCYTDSRMLLDRNDIDIVIDATGSPAAGIAHVLACCETRKHIIMVNVEADALAGPWLAEQARAAGILYSLAYGDQPALICELVDWARACGLEVISAGKGTQYLPHYHTSTPETVWCHYGINPRQAQDGGLNAKMFNSFLDGTKSAIEMCAVANATGLAVPDGLFFPPCSTDDLPSVLCPGEDGGALQHRGQVEVISSLNRDGSPVARDLRWGVFVTFAGGSPYVERCFKEYGLVTNTSGQYSALYRPFHLIGLELGISVAHIGLLGEPTGTPTHFNADVVAVAKQDLAAGQVLDGEGGFTVYGRLMPAKRSLIMGALPIGLAQDVPLINAVRAGQIVRWNDVEIDENTLPVHARRATEKMLT